MKLYLRVENGEVAEFPLYASQIVHRFPNTSFPVPFEAPEGYEEVVQTESPIIDYTKNATGDTVKLIDGVWVQQWTISDASNQEITKRTNEKAIEIRAERNSRLSESDWTQLPDSAADKDSWVEYRQLLRDVTTQPEFPWNVQWPDKPA